MNRDGEGNPDDLKTRTKAFALRIILLYVALWRSAFLLHPSAFILHPWSAPSGLCCGLPVTIVA